MKRYVRANDDKLQQAHSMVKELLEKKIGHAGYPETYKECWVFDGRKWKKGRFVGCADDGSWFRVRTLDAGVGAYTERNYSLSDIEFIN